MTDAELDQAFRLLRKKQGFATMTAAEADKAYDEAEPVPMSRDEIDRIVNWVTSDRRCQKSKYGQHTWMLDGCEPNVICGFCGARGRDCEECGGLGCSGAIPDGGDICQACKGERVMFAMPPAP